MALSLPRARVLSIGGFGSETTHEVELVFTIPESADFGPDFVKTLVFFHQNQMRLSRAVLRSFSSSGPDDHPEKGNNEL